MIKDALFGTNEYTLALGKAAPIYNLALVIIAIILFIKLFKSSKVYYRKPWEIIFIALLVFIAEEIVTILRSTNLINIPIHINGFFELVMVSLFIYAILLQKQCVAKDYKTKKN